MSSLWDSMTLLLVLRPYLLTNQTHDSDESNFGIVDYLIEARVPLFGRGVSDNTTETPFKVAVRRNAFHLADKLLALSDKAVPLHAVSTCGAMITSPYPLTPLGHTTALNARYAGLRTLRYLLDVEAKVVVKPMRGLTVLHLVALVCTDVIRIWE